MSIIGILSFPIPHSPFFILHSSFSIHHSPVVINELQYHPLSDDHGEEYIELHNTDTVTVTLAGWSFSDGIDYTFPVSASIPPGGYLVVGHDPATVEALYGISGVLGPFEDGRLANEGERVAIQDDLGDLVDEVTYDDHLPWPEPPDGDGPSLELINPAFDNDGYCAWGASAGPSTGSGDNLGTPGAQNSIYSTDNISPCLTDVAHSPTFPTSSQPVTVTARVDDVGLAAEDSDTSVTVTLHYRPELTADYVTLPMTRSQASENFYSAVIPPQDDGLYVEFYVSAVDAEDAMRLAPEDAPGTISEETGNPLTISYLYQVEDTSPPTGTLPIYRLIFTQENWTELTTRDLFSNERLDATFVYAASLTDEVFYNVGVRYRGESTRDVWPRPYRINFRDEQEFQERERVNLVGDALGREALAHDLFRRVGLPSPETQFVRLYVNESRHGDYLDVEQVDNEFLRAHFPEADAGLGNLYRGFDGADLSYRGPDPESYRPYYLKENNEEADDYSDIIALTDALTNSPDGSFRAEAESVAHMRQWLRWFAVQAVLDNHEGALWIGIGDDYFLYRCPAVEGSSLCDDRFLLISWDHDGTFTDPSHSIWEPEWLGPPIVSRILNYPDFTRWYYQEIAAMVENEFSLAEMEPRIDALPEVVSSADREWLRQYVTARIPALLNQIPDTSLSISTNAGEDFFTEAEEVTLEGNCSPLRDLMVNSDEVGVEYPTATSWRYTSTLPARDNVFVVSDGLVTRTITVYRDLFQGGDLEESVTLPGSAQAYQINENILVPAGLTLTVESGAALQFSADRYLRVNEGGRLLIEGSAAQPVILTGQNGAYWGGILLDRTQADNRISHAVIEYTHKVIENPRTHGVSAYGARVTIADSILRHTDSSVAVQTYPWFGREPTIYLLRNEIYDIGSDAVHVTGGYAFLQGNHIYDVERGVYPLEGIQVSDMITPAQVLDNHIHDTSDECLDLNDASAIIERNELHHCADKGISIGHPSSTTLVNNLIYACVGGIAVKDSAVSHIINNTVTDCEYGLSLFDHEGGGGGVATLVNTILWGNGTNLSLDALSVVTVTYSDVGLNGRLVQSQKLNQSGVGNDVWPGEGNINVDPLFRAPESGICRLREDSPCVDTGTSAGAPDVDLRGVYRPHGAGYDRGAHEFFEYFSCYLPLLLRE